MPKYYVSSGELRVAVDENTPHQAALTVFYNLKNHPASSLGKITMVSELGFDSQADEDVYMLTLELLDETDQLDQFSSPEWKGDGNE